MNDIEKIIVNTSFVGANMTEFGIESDFPRFGKISSTNASLSI